MVVRREAGGSPVSLGGRKGQKGTELVLSPQTQGPGVGTGCDAAGGAKGTDLGGQKGQHPKGCPFVPPSPAPVPLGAGQPEAAEAGKIRETYLSRSSSSHGAAVGRGTETGGTKPVLSPGRPSSRFLDLDEAAYFDERAAIREHDGGLPRAAAERLAWLDVLAARQVAAGALNSLREAS